MSVFAKDFERVLNTLVSESEMIGSSVSKYNSYDVSKSDTEYKYTFIATGVQKNDLNIEIVDDCIVLKATPSVKTRFSKDINALIYLHKDVDVENIKANLSDGLLTVTLPKLQSVRKNVKVSIS